MKRTKLSILMLLFSFSFMFCALNGNPDDGYELWLNYQPVQDADLLASYQEVVSSLNVEGNSPTCDIIRTELKNGLTSLLQKEIAVHPGLPVQGTLLVSLPANSPFVQEQVDNLSLSELGDEGFIIQTAQAQDGPCLIVTANAECGLLYGTFHLLRLMQTHQTLTDIHVTSKPKIQYRVLNHWDNMNRSVERGYAGKSLWKWDELPGTLDPRYADYARANASLGINGSVLNNVNADPRILTHEYLEKVAAIAKVFRPYGIRVFLSIKFSAPIKPSQTGGRPSGGIGTLETADPLDPDVRQWWKEKVVEIYDLIPDFGGFLVKANSEGQPGPQDYLRTHADGANMLAEALAPFHGVVMWRAFVYSFDVNVDRAKQAYMEFKPLDGEFLPNVLIQAKNGPIDFQPREPIQPLFGAMPHTSLMVELQITQEYLGHSTHLVYLAPMWKEYLEFDTYANGKGSPMCQVIDGTLQGYQTTGIAGVANAGSDRNWTGHLFGQSNWYAFGRLAWDHTLSADAIADEWIRMTFSSDPEVINQIKAMMMNSWEACINYTTPLGLHHIMQGGYHYGPGPDVNWMPRADWNSTYYHQADSAGVGFDRTATGSDAASQYAPEVASVFENLETCPEKYLLWFHHVPWNYSMKSGRTLWDEMCLHYEAGVDTVKVMRATWDSLEGKIDQGLFDQVKQKLAENERDATIWKDTCISYFQKFSQMPVPKGE